MENNRLFLDKRVPSPLIPMSVYHQSTARKTARIFIEVKVLYERA